MIRTPELKKQVALLESEIAAVLPVSLPHSAALEIIAKLNGFKNWRHAASEVKNSGAQSAVQSNEASQPIQLAVVFGEEDTCSLEESGAVPETLDSYTLKTFNTEAEKSAYLEGLSDMDGWMAYSIVEDKVGEFFAQFAPGEDAVEIRKLLAKHGFESSNDRDEFEREITLELEFGDITAPRAFQVITFIRDAITGAPFINLNCFQWDSGEYITDDPLYTGETVMEALSKALTDVESQRTTCLKLVESYDKSR